MNFDSSNYFAYKKRKTQTIAQTKKPISKMNFLFQLFIATFILIFIIIVMAIMKYSMKMDIEYASGDLTLNGQEIVNTQSAIATPGEDDTQRKIDKRLLLIQQEENAPSEAKIIKDSKKQPEIIDPKHLETNKKIEKIEKIQKQKAQLEDLSEEKPKIMGALESLKSTKKANNELNADKNITIMSKVLIGRYSTFEKAKEAQDNIKNNYPQLSPFVRKISDVYTIQMGSYQEFQMAKTQAQELKNLGFDVWIYQQ